MQIKNLSGRVLREVPGNSLRGADLRGADLSEADLPDADLRKAILSGADLSGANLSKARLCKADLCRADLRWSTFQEARLSAADLRWAALREAFFHKANLRQANLSRAVLRRANLSEADLREADLSLTDLREADMTGADLSGADLTGAHIEGTVLPQPIVPSDGEFTGYKKVLQADATYTVVILRIPADAQRTSALASRKCRASHVIVVEGEGISPTASRSKLRYTPGATVTADRFNPDRREECTYGIHFFLTREEAEAYLP